MRYFILFLGGLLNQSAPAWAPNHTPAVPATTGGCGGESGAAANGHCPARLADATIISFGVRRQVPDVVLTWSTAGEVNTVRFDVERSPDGSTFQPVGRVAAAGSSQTLRSYAFTDRSAQPLRSVPSFYRLATVNADSTRRYEPIRQLAADPVALGGLRPQLYPNPTNGLLGIMDAPGEVPVRVVDPLGRVRATGTTDRGGQASLPLPPGLTKGVYVVRCGHKVAHLVVTE